MSDADFDPTLSIQGAPARLRGDFVAGDRIARYELIDRLGAGGMGVVWRARDTELDREVAIKLVRSVVSADGQQRLRREAQAMAKLSHPAVVPVFDIGTVDDQVYVVMELVEGTTLGRYLRDRAPVPWRDAVRLFVHCGRGLAAAHAAGIVHRDFKPDNVLVDREGRARVTDFGLAVTGDSTDGEIVGTPRYMAPEQRAGDATTKSDQFAFSIALDEALRGRDEHHQVRIPAAIETIVRRGCSADPAKRWPALAELVDALERVPVRRRRIALGIGVLAGAGAIAAIAIATRPAQTTTKMEVVEVDPCAALATSFDGTWDATIRTRITQAFSSIPGARTPEIVKRTTAILDRRRTDWLAARMATCRAAAASEVSAPIAEARIECLERRRDELGALVRLFEKPDDKLLGRAIAAADDTARVDTCARELPKPSASGESKRSDAPFVAARQAVTEALALRKVGRVGDAIAVLPKVIDQALATNARGLAGTALLDLAVAQASVDPAAAATSLARATQLAGESGDDPLAARCLIQAIYLTGYIEKHTDEALAQRPNTELAIARAGSLAALRFAYHQNVGMVLAVADRPAESIKALQAALDIDDAGGEPNVTAQLAVLNGLGNVTEEAGDFAGARKIFERARELIEKRDGPDAPLVAYPLNNLGNILVREGKHAEALAAYQRAFAIFEANLPPTSPVLGVAAMNVASELDVLGRSAEALPLYRRSLALREAALGKDHADVAQTLVNFATFYGAQRQFSEGKAMFERAIAIRRKAYGKDHLLLASALANYGGLLVEAGTPAAAIAPAREALAIFDRTKRSDHPLVIEPLLTLARASIALGQTRGAVTYLERAVALTTKPAPEHLGQASFMLAEAVATTDRVRARQLAQRAHDLLAPLGVVGEPWTSKSAAWLAAH